MAKFIQDSLAPDYQDRCVEKWAKILDIPGKEITNEYTRIATAVVLENTQKECFAEAYGDGFGAQSIGGNGGGAFDTYTAGGYGGAAGAGVTGGAQSNPDSRIPSIVIPTARRVFPELLAHEVCGVQPMNGPVGFAFAFRAMYDVGAQFTAAVAPGVEIGYNNLDSAFTGTSGNTSTINTNATFFSNYAGTNDTAGLYGNTVARGGTGAPMSMSEWAKIGTDMPMAKFRMEKAVVEAKARKMAAHWSLELAEDMKRMHGIDVDNEMVNIISYELNAEMDRQLVTEMVIAAIQANNTSSWTPVSADGRSQMERIATLYTHILDKSQEVAIKTRRGSANFAIASPKVCALLQRMGDFKFWGEGMAKVETSQIGVSKVGTLAQGGIKVFRDTFAGGNYILLGYKGSNPYDSGIIYCPYIPVQLMRAVGPDDFTPRLGARTRYGILNNLFGAGIYYHFIAINNLTSAGMADGNRIFSYAST